MAADLYDLIHDRERAEAPPEAPPYVRGSPTSQAAAEAIVPLVQKQRAAVLAAVQQSQAGLTRQQIEEVTGIDGNAVRPRVVELMERGRLVETQETRRTRAGRLAAVLRAVLSGEASCET